MALSQQGNAPLIDALLRRRPAPIGARPDKSPQECQSECAAHGYVCLISQTNPKGRNPCVLS
jgi:hypothetical protein